ncbi:restriction endonuclease subunit S [Vibrio parahaemolyticus]
MTDKQTVKFGDICKEVKLTTKDPIGDGYERYIGLEHLDSGSLKIKRWGSIIEDNPSFTRVFKKGQILFGKRRPYLRKAAVAEFDGICSSDILVLDVKDNKVNFELFYYLVKSEAVWAEAIRSSSGSLSPRTKFKSLANVEFKLPSSSELVSISNFLHNSSLVVDQTRLVIQGAKRAAQASIRCLLRYGFTKKDKLCMTPNFGMLPPNWKLSLLESFSNEGCSAIRTGPFGSALKGDHWRAHGRPVITIGCLGEYGYERSEELFIEEEYAEKLSSYAVEYGDIVFSRVADIGRSVLIGVEQQSAIISSNLMKISLDNNKVDPKFIYYSIKYSPIVIHQIQKYTNSGGRMLVTSRDLKTIYFPTPPLNEQREIANKIEAILTLSEMVDDSTSKQECLLNSYVNDIIS